MGSFACRLRQSRRQCWLEYQRLGQEQHAPLWRCDGVQKGHHAWADARVRCADPSPGHPKRNQSRLLSHWFRALRSVRVPYLQIEVEDGQGNWRKKDGGPSLIEVK